MDIFSTRFIQMSKFPQETSGYLFFLLSSFSGRQGRGSWGSSAYFVFLFYVGSRNHTGFFVKYDLC